MSKKALPVGTMFLVLVIALSVLGVGYALWSETLTIQGNVQTGEVDVALTDAEVLECVVWNGVLTCPEPVEKEDAANCTIASVDSGEQGNDGASQLNVTVTGMYPGYHCKVEFKVQSLGNVPVHVWLPEEVGTIPAWVDTNFEDCYGDGTQLHQNDKTDACTMDLHFTNEQAPLENSGPYTFSWTILATQWNEDPIIEPVVVPGYDSTAVKKGQVRYRNFRTQGNGWEFAVGTNVPASMTPVDWTYSANWFFAPDYNTITFVYDGAKVSTTVVANGTTYTNYAEYSTGNLGEVDYMQWLVRGATGQTVDFYDVELTVGGITYALGDFSQTASTANWNISNFDLSGGFTLTGKIKLTGQSTGDEHAKVDITIGDIP